MAESSVEGGPRLTERAAAEATAMAADCQAVGAYLRIGCIGSTSIGIEYRLGFVTAMMEDDWMEEQHGVRLIIDPFSFEILDGATLDYIDDSRGTGFWIDNPRVLCRCKPEAEPGD